MKTPNLPTGKQIGKMTDTELVKWWDWLQSTFDFSHAIVNEIKKRDLVA